MPSVLIVDDLTAIHEMLAAVIQPTGYSMAFADNGDEALEKYKAESFDVVLADISMQPMDGITLLQQLKGFDPECVVIMMTGYASTDTAIKALKFGAFDYIQKPFKIDELIQTLKRAVEFGSRNRGKRSDVKEDLAAKEVDISSRIVGKSSKINRLRQQVSKLIGAHSPLLIQGEAGTGKKTLAELIHEGAGGGGPFIMIDCGMSSDTNFEGGLVGLDGQGGDWVSRAKSGMLFLQNIERLPLDFQQALVGILKRTINETRIVCASAVDLEQLVDEGKFHDEFFYRVAALPVFVPPLREHLEDLPLLVKYFTQQARNAAFEGAQIEFEPEALAAMARYPWPGNVVELQQVVGSLVSQTAQRLIGVDSLPARIARGEGWPTLADYLAEQEGQYVRRVLRACGGDRDRAAQILGCPVEKFEQAEA